MNFPITPHHRLGGHAHDAEVIVITTVKRVVALDGWGTGTVEGVVVGQRTEVVLIGRMVRTVRYLHPSLAALTPPAVAFCTPPS